MFLKHYNKIKSYYGRKANSLPAVMGSINYRVGFEIPSLNYRVGGIEKSKQK